MVVIIMTDFLSNIQHIKQNKMSTTYAQDTICKRIKAKLEMKDSFQDYGGSLHDDHSDWVEYEEYYGTDYNDCHGDYYDAEAEN